MTTRNLTLLLILWIPLLACGCFQPGRIWTRMELFEGERAKDVVELRAVMADILHETPPDLRLFNPHWRIITAGIHLHDLLFDALKGADRLLIIEDIQFEGPGSKYPYRVAVWGFAEGEFLAYSNDGRTLVSYKISEAQKKEFRRLLEDLPASGLGSLEWIKKDVKKWEDTNDAHTVYVWGKDGDTITCGRITCPTRDPPLSPQEMWIERATNKIIKAAGINFWKPPDD